MKIAPYLFILASTSCASEGTSPVDAIFRVSVTNLGDTCGGKPVPEDVTGLVDVFLRTDGTVTIHPLDSWLPMPDTFGSVPIDGNYVDGKQPWQAPSGQTRERRLKGGLSPNLLDLTLAIEDETSGGASCQRKYRLKGPPRPLGDPSALDGIYLTTLTGYGQVCPGDPLPDHPWSLNMRLDVDPARPDDPTFTLDSSVSFAPGVPGGDGAVDWSGTASIQGGGNVQATFKGVFDPGGIDTMLTLSSPQGGCPSVYHLGGSKRIPSSKTLDGAYRASYVWKDACEGMNGVYQAPIDFMLQPDGTYWLYDLNYILTFQPPGTDGSFNGHFIDIFGSGADITYDGTAKPPGLSYHATYVYPFDPPCTLTLDVTSQKRFVPQDE